MPLPIIWLLCFFGIPMLLGALFTFVYVPLRLRNKFPHSILPNFEPTSIETLTPEMRDLIGKHVRDFAAEGFTVAANLTKRLGDSDVRGVQILLFNEKTGDVGIILFASAKNTRNCVFAIRSQFADGDEVATGCNRNVGFSPRHPKVNTATFSWARDVTTIAEIHRRRLDRLGRLNTPRVALNPGEAIKYAETRYEIELARFVASGYYFRDEKARILRKTWKGTFLTVWKLTPPIKGWRTRYRDWKARKTWNALGMDRWKRPAAAAGADAKPDEAIVNGDPSEPSTSIGYQANLAAGELRVRHESGSAVVRLGKLSVATYLLSRWATLLTTGIYLFAIFAYLLSVWAQYSFWARAGLPIHTIFGGAAMWLGVLLVLMALDIFSLIRGFVNIGGTSMVTASHEGLHYAGAPSRRRNGFIPRDELQNIRVVFAERRIFSALHRLEARRYDQKPAQPLLVANNKAILLDARISIAVALGIELDNDAAPG